jgi:D-arabinose 1-dehydrogenase-like Zn-dependent alcohol dehydrogenase
MKLDNRAAYLCAPCLDVEVRAAPYTEPDEYEIVIRNHAVAINPVNWIKQHAGDGFAPWVKYPFVLGNDVAGEVVQVGAKVTSFHIGDRVLGHAVGMSQKVNRPAEGAFQLYTILRSHMASHIPDSVSYDKASVVPLGLSTAAQCLFSKAFLALPLPTVPQGEGSRDGKQGTIVIWGGSSSVGCNAIQLAIAAGLRVITTASPHNHSLMKQLGADAVFDYSSPTIVEDLAASVNSYPGDLVGILPISNGSLGECVDLMLSVTSTAPHRKHRKFICQFSSDLPKAGFRRGSTEWPTIDGVAMTSTERAKAAGIEVKFVIGSDIMHDPIVSKGIYGQFLLQALAEGTFVPAPEPLVVGNGLEYVQKALDLNRKGVSARKVVVCL